MSDLTFPADLRYTQDHEWARKDGNAVVVGITAFAQSQLGDVVYVELPEPGKTVTAGESFGVVESTKAVSELIAPVTGTVVERNDPLVDSPEKVNDDPYDAGWMIKVEPADPSAFDKLMDAAAYGEFVAKQG
ncbi:glycine cleavage system protein GcvH [Vulgatibacter incomptus]|uniref:Glycine cleavage system H protein n=1 Tax=Vulgatibacter incomptus TaxID=1391653 RepID=A0A0K1P8H9_9BACT|nr:glycine cleavage system protein GcvH [Vulgatibacter incomptus]AKU89807.1 Glycine cleavage system H protein [Vulgatibacter incomptus]